MASRRNNMIHLGSNVRRMGSKPRFERRGEPKSAAIIAGAKLDAT
jgi:hypothetical protein